MGTVWGARLRKVNGNRIPEQSKNRVQRILRKLRFGISSVSYTHLDVYKRQELAGLLIDSLEASGDRRNAKKQFEKYNSLWLEEMGQELTYDRSL